MFSTFFGTAATATSATNSQTKSGSLDVKTETSPTTFVKAGFSDSPIDLVSDDETEVVDEHEHEHQHDPEHESEIKNNMEEEIEYDVNTQDEQTSNQHQQQEQHDMNIGTTLNTFTPVVTPITKPVPPIDMSWDATHEPDETQRQMNEMDEIDEEDDYDSDDEEIFLSPTQQRRLKTFIISTLEEISSRHLLTSSPSPPSRMTRMARIMSSCMSSSLMILSLVLLVCVLVFHLAILTKANNREL